MLSASLTRKSGPGLTRLSLGWSNSMECLLLCNRLSIEVCSGSLLLFNKQWTFTSWSSFCNAISTIIRVWSTLRTFWGCKAGLVRQLIFWRDACTHSKAPFHLSSKWCTEARSKTRVLCRELRWIYLSSAKIWTKYFANVWSSTLIFWAEKAAIEPLWSFVSCFWA